MSQALLVLRPEPGLGETVMLARRCGLSPVASPLFAIIPVQWDAPAAEQFDAVLAGSANAFRHGGAALTALRHLPVHAVGERTAQAARDAGFVVASCGAGGLQAVLDALPPPAHLLRLAGAERVELDLPVGITLAERVVYQAEPVPLNDEALGALGVGAVALVHSAEAARRFAGECERAGIDRSAVTLAALGPRIVDAAGPGWRSVVHASEPTDAALLALAAELCQG